MNYIELYDWDFLDNFNDFQYNVLKNLQLNVENNDFEINVARIIKDFGIDLEDISSEDVSGKTKSNVIQINKSEPRERRKFSMAHELGHIILSPGDKTFYRFMDPTNYSTLEKVVVEREANKFAANLLMPLKLVECVIEFISQEHDKELTDDKLISEVREKMHLSYTFVGYRLKNLGFIGGF